MEPQLLQNLAKDFKDIDIHSQTKYYCGKCDKSIIVDYAMKRQADRIDGHYKSQTMCSPVIRDPIVRAQRGEN
jgi:hypothetical protein